MRQKFSTFFFLFLTLSINALTQPASIHGKILDKHNNVLPGANIIIVGTKYGVNSNEAGEYLFDQIPYGKSKVQASLSDLKQ